MNYISYVINLENRNDRLDNFKNSYDSVGPGSEIPLIITKAVDGTEELVPKELEEFINSIKGVNDFNNCPRVSACALSHINVWKMIAESDKIGLVFEDDANFREDDLLIKNLSNIVNDIKNIAVKENSIIYLGAGDILPIHVNIRSESLLNAQEKSHSGEMVSKYIGIPKKSLYLFEHFGAFSYAISPETAKFLLNNLEKNPINTRIDLYLRDTLNKYVIVPFITYHGRINIRDSDVYLKK